MEKYKVVIIPSKREEEEVVLENNHVFITPSRKNRPSVFNAKTHNLYIVDTKSSIEIGDYYYNPDFDFIFKKRVADKTENRFKVVASTDSSLNLPVIPEPFVKTYIEDNDLIVNGLFSKNNTAIISWTTSEQQMFNKGIIKAESHEGLEAKSWWYSLSVVAQTHFTNLYFDTDSIIVNEQQIIEMFTSENEKKSAYDKMFAPDFLIENSEYWDQEPQVDFELLKKTIRSLEQRIAIFQSERANLLLFFESMKKSSFAHKASKELQ